MFNCWMDILCGKIHWIVSLCGWLAVEAVLLQTLCYAMLCSIGVKHDTFESPASGQSVKYDTFGTPAQPSPASPAQSAQPAQPSPVQQSSPASPAEPASPAQPAQPTASLPSRAQHSRPSRPARPAQPIITKKGVFDERCDNSYIENIMGCPWEALGTASIQYLAPQMSNFIRKNTHNTQMSEMECVILGCPSGKAKSEICVLESQMCVLPR